MLKYLLFVLLAAATIPTTAEPTSCSCIGCTNTASVSAGSTSTIINRACTNTAYSYIVDELNIASTDGSGFDVYSQPTPSSTIYFTAGSATSVTCFDAFGYGGTNNTMAVIVKCKNWIYSCPLIYTFTSHCSSLYSWYTGTWSTCSSSCTQTRTVACRDSSGTTVSDLYCAATKPATSQSCTGGYCPSTTYSWYTGTWSTCSSLCTHSRTVACHDSNGASVGDSYCTEPMPDTVGYCTGGFCTEECLCDCCVGNFCTRAVVGQFTNPDCGSCTTATCYDHFPSSCPAPGTAGSSASYCAVPTAGVQATFTAQTMILLLIAAVISL